jgi:hypothetical protein
MFLCEKVAQNLAQPMFCHLPKIPTFLCEISGPKFWGTYAIKITQSEQFAQSGHTGS